MLFLKFVGSITLDMGLQKVHYISVFWLRMFSFYAKGFFLKYLLLALLNGIYLSLAYWQCHNEIWLFSLIIRWLHVYFYESFLLRISKGALNYVHFEWVVFLTESFIPVTNVMCTHEYILICRNIITIMDSLYLIFLPLD
jgi:hypothetical protein